MQNLQVGAKFIPGAQGSHLLAMGKKIVSSLLFLTFINAAAQKPAKSVFAGNYPIEIAFRGEYINTQHKSYASWKAAVQDADGVLKKFVQNDELGEVNLNSGDWARRFMIESPQTLVMLHWDAREHRNDKQGSSDRYFPGHWLVMEGTTLGQPLTKTDQTLTVANSQPFTPTTTAKGSTQPIFKFPSLLLVARKPDGSKDWSRYEVVRLESVNGNALTIKRGQALSAPQSFENGAFVAPLATRLGNPDLFCYNWSTTCPRDAAGKTAADVLVEELKSIVGANGSHAFLDGIAFDVLMWAPWDGRNGKADVDHDGRADGGVIEGSNVWRNGAYQLMLQLRQAFPNLLLTCDGYTEEDQRGVHLFNGIESEGLVRHNDAFRAISKTINVFRYWQANNRRLPQFNYIIPKLENPADAANGTQLIRLATGMAVVLETGIAKKPGDASPDEIIKGADNQRHWLGKPVGPLMDLAAKTDGQAYFTSPETQAGFLKACNAPSLNLRFDGNKLVVENRNLQKPLPALTVQLTMPGNSGDDVVIYAKVRSLDTLAGLSAQVPSIFRVSADGLPQYETNERNNEMYQNLWALVDNRQATPLSFYYRQAGGRTLTLRLLQEGMKGFEIEELRIVPKPQVWARLFENGLVLVNPSLKTVSFPLQELFKGYRFKKLTGTTDPGYNNGEAVGTAVDVPERNALFLIKEK